MMGTSSTHRAEVERLAYHLWQERGRPIGSPEADWLQAERMIADGWRGTTPPQPGAGEPVASQPDGTGAAPAPGTLAAKVRDEAAAAAANDPAHTDAGGSLRTVDFPQVTDPSPSAPGPARPRGRRAGASPPARRGG